MIDPSAAVPVTDWLVGYDRQTLESCASTNAFALEQATTAIRPVWLMTLDQTAGRGRRGRVWAMPSGNFAATLLLPRPGDVASAARISFVAALAVDDALRAVCGPRARTAIKWPNDNLLNGSKVAGILLESTTRGGTEVEALAVGIGVNLAAAPDAAMLEPQALRATSVLAETASQVSPHDFLDVLAAAFAPWLSMYYESGFAPIRDAWLTRAARLGETIIARTGRAELTGRFQGIDETGALILQTSNGRQMIAAADIQFGVV